MVVLMIMAVGVLIGFKWFPERFQKLNGQIQVLSIVVLIFCMGVSLGNNPTFIEDLFSLGYKSLVFAVLPIIGSIVIVYYLTKKILK